VDYQAERITEDLSFFVDDQSRGWGTGKKRDSNILEGRGIKRASTK